MIKMHETSCYQLIASCMGNRAADILGTLDLDRLVMRPPSAKVDRLTLAAALNAVLFQELLDRVPTGAAYVAGRRAAGARIMFDHGALRTVRFPDSGTGGLPAGEEAFTRILLPLGYVLADIYPLPRLKMTGRAYVHADAPETMPQFFLSELHVERFDPGFAAAARRVFGASEDPLPAAVTASLAHLAGAGELPFADARHLLAALVAAFDRHHPVPLLSDYEILLAGSVEAAWIATEGNAFNHATDRVTELDAVVLHERAQGRPVKDLVEISANGRIRQTAHRAASVRRAFRDGEGLLVERTVPGSFYEFISRDIDPETGRMDLGFDSGNATGIFAMTRAA